MAEQQNAAAAVAAQPDVKPTIAELRLAMKVDKPSTQEINLATTTSIDQLIQQMTIIHEYLLPAREADTELQKANKARFLQINNDNAGINNVAISQSQKASANEKRVENPPTVTLILPEPADAKQDCSNIKTMKLPIYSGDESGVVNCLTWLSKVMSAANTGKLTHLATIMLMIDRSDSSANSKIRQCLRLKMSLYEIVLKLETAFARVPPPAEARVQVNNMLPHEREGLAHFAIRLADISLIAARDIKDEDERIEMEQRMCKTNYMRVLPVHLYNFIVQRESELARIGKPLLTFEGTCIMIEDYQNTQQTKQTRDRAEKLRLRPEPNPNDRTQRNQYNRIRQIAEEPNSDYMVNDPMWCAGDTPMDAVNLDPQGYQDFLTFPTEEDEPEELYTHEEVVCYVNQAQVGQQPNFRGRQLFRGRGRGRPAPYDRPTPDRRERVNQAPDAEDDDYKLPGLLQERKPNFQAYRLPQLANCDNEPNRCFRCGMETTPPHRQAETSCPLYNMPLTDRACMTCGKGLHFPKNCPKAFQARFRPLADYRAKN